MNVEFGFSTLYTGMKPVGSLAAEENYATGLTATTSGFDLIGTQ